MVARVCKIYFEYVLEAALPLLRRDFHAYIYIYMIFKIINAVQMDAKPGDDKEVGSRDEVIWSLVLRVGLHILHYIYLLFKTENAFYLCFA